MIYQVAEVMHLRADLFRTIQIANRSGKTEALIAKLEFPCFTAQFAICKVAHIRSPTRGSDLEGGNLGRDCLDPA